MAYGHSADDNEMLRESSIRIERERFLEEPPAVQQETRERVKRTLRAEKARGQKSHSALWQQAAAIYGVDPRNV